MADLYPSFDIPVNSTTTLVEEQSRRFKPAPYFDFSLGDFVRDGAHHVVMQDGREAYKNWCEKILYTEYGSCLSYLGVGIDLDSAVSAPSRSAAESILTRTITETLSRHPCTDKVYDFSYTWLGEAVYLTFKIQPKSWANFTIEHTIT